MLREGSIYVVGTVVQSGLAFLLLPVVTRVLDVSEYGLVGTATAVAGLLSIGMGLGMNFAIVRSYYDDPTESPAAGWSALLRAQMLIAAGLGVLAFVTGPLWAGLFRGFGWDLALQLAVLYAYLTAVQLTLVGVLRAARRPVAFVVVTVIQVLVGTGAGLALAVSGGAAGYVGGLCIGVGSAAVVTFLITRKPPLWQRDVITEGLALGLPFMTHQFAGWGIALSDRVLIGFYLGLSAVGRYQVAYVLGTAVILLLGGAQAAWAPYYQGELSPETRRKMPPLLVLPVTALAGAVAGLMVVSAPLLLAVMVPDAYGGTELIIALVAAATLARAPYLMAVVVLVDAKAAGSIATASVIGVFVNIGLNMVLIPILGLPAAAAATGLAVVVQAVAVLRRTEALIDQSMRFRKLMGIWIVGTMILVGISQIPTSGVGVVMHILLAAGICAFGAAAARWLVRSFRAGYASASAGPPSAVSLA